MAGWVFPALKAILPHVGTIVQAAKPVFARNSAGDRPSVEAQIAEVEAAITRNADHIQALAEQLQQTVKVLEAEAEATRERLKRTYALCATALAASLIAVGLAVYALLAAS